jgi:hypothetical protein
MDIIFDESFHHISQEGFLQHDGVQIYQDAINISKVTKLRTSSATIKTSISSSRPYAYPSALTLFALTISSVALNKLLEKLLSDIEKQALFLSTSLELFDLAPHRNVPPPCN